MKRKGRRQSIQVQDLVNRRKQEGDENLPANASTNKGRSLACRTVSSCSADTSLAVYVAALGVIRAKRVFGLTEVVFFLLNVSGRTLNLDDIGETKAISSHELAKLVQGLPPSE